MKIRDYSPSKGQAFQGDVAIIPIPKNIKISRENEISPREGKLILQEGELTGHHHHIRQFRQSTLQVGDPGTATRDRKLRKMFGGKSSISARMFRDPLVAAEMQRRGILTRTDLVVGCLVVEGESVVVEHQEHDGIRLPVGNYLIGRQIESAGAEERVVRD